MKKEFIRSQCMLLNQLIMSFADYDMPCDIYNDIINLSAKIDNIVDKGFIYMVEDDGENIDYKEIPIL